MEQAKKSSLPGFSSDVLNSLPNAFRLWEKCIRLNLQVCEPCIVEEYDREKHEAVVRPLVKHFDQEGAQSFPKSSIRVSVLRWSSGGFLIDSPLEKGDTGWVISSDRDSGSAKRENAELDSSKNRGPQDLPSNSEADHILSRGFFISDKWGRVTIPEEDSRSLVIEHLDGDGFSNGKITISRDGEATVSSFNRSDGKVYNSRIVVNGKGISLVREDTDLSGKDLKNAVETESLSFLTEDGFVWNGKYDRSMMVVTGLRYNEVSSMLEAQAVTLYFRGDIIVGKSKPTDWLAVAKIEGSGMDTEITSPIYEKDEPWPPQKQVLRARMLAAPVLMGSDGEIEIGSRMPLGDPPPSVPPEEGTPTIKITESLVDNIRKFKLEVVHNCTLKCNGVRVASFAGTNDVDISTGDSPDPDKKLKQNGEKKTQFYGTSDVDIIDVESLNDLNKNISIIGGKQIEVSTNGQTIRIGYKEGKEPDPEPDPQQKGDCEHDYGSGNEGGVSPDREISESPYGGVPSDSGAGLGGSGDDCNRRC